MHTIDSSSISSSVRQRALTTDIVSRPASAHVDTLRWNLSNAQERLQLLGLDTDSQLGSSSSPDPSPNSIGGIVWGTSRGLVGEGNRLLSRAKDGHRYGQRLLDRSAAIFRRYPALYIQNWEFSVSPVTGKGGASGSLGQYLNAAGIQHNGQTPHPSHAGSIANAAQAQAVGVPAKQINNYNGDIAEKAIADRLESQGYTVKRNVEINTPLGKRDVDILATKHQGHPTLSEEIHIESKVGRKSLPSTAQGSNVRMQIDKDAAVLAQQKSLGPAAQARGRQLYDQGATALKKKHYFGKGGQGCQIYRQSGSSHWNSYQYIGNWQRFSSRWQQNRYQHGR